VTTLHIGGFTGIFSKATSGFQKSGLQGFAAGAAQVGLYKLSSVERTIHSSLKAPEPIE
jgi:hypothetical protein